MCIVYEEYDPKDWEHNEVIDEHELDHIEQGIHNASIQILTNIEDIENLQDSVGDISSDLEDAKDDISAIDSDVSHLGDLLDTARTDIDTAVAEIGSLDVRVTALEQGGSLPGLTSRVEILESDVAIIQDSITWDVRYNND